MAQSSLHHPQLNQKTSTLKGANLSTASFGRLNIGGSAEPSLIVSPPQTTINTTSAPETKLPDMMRSGRASALDSSIQLIQNLPSIGPNPNLDEEAEGPCEDNRSEGNLSEDSAETKERHRPSEAVQINGFITSKASVAASVKSIPTQADDSSFLNGLAREQVTAAEFN